MKRISTLYGNYILELETTDFTVGDIVKYTGHGDAPNCLCECILHVSSINDETITVECEEYPSEHWNIKPAYLQIVTKNT